MNAQRTLWVGVDVGGTKIEAMAIDPSSQPVGPIRLPTPDSGPEHLVEAIEMAVRRVVEEAGGSTAEIIALGIGIPGQVREGVVHLAVNLHLRDYPLARVLEERFGRPVRVENDVRTAALGAYRASSTCEGRCGA